MIKDEYGVLYSEDGKFLLGAPKDIITYKIPNGVVSIYEQAFNDCKNLTSLTIPNTITSIKKGAFSGCTSLVAIYYEGNIKSWINIIWDTSVVCAYDLYINNILLTEVILPNDITEINKNAFYYCRSLKKIKFNNQLFKIGPFAFSKSGLTGVVVLPKELRQVMQHAFFNCSSVTEIIISDKVSEFYFGAVSACYALYNIVVSEQNEVYKSVDGVLYNKNTDTLSAFPIAKYKKESFELPKWVKNIAKDVFCYSSLPDKGLIINHNLDFIEAGAFREAVGKVYVPVGSKEKFVKFGISEKVVEEHFVSEFAFKSGRLFLTAITENPYRILGIYANASIKEIIANATKIKRFLDVGKTIDFPTDFNSILPSVVRTQETVEDALNKIKLPEHKLTYAFFWIFSCNNSVEGEIAIEYLKSGNLDKSLDIFGKISERNTNAIINQSTVVFFKQDYIDGLLFLLCMIDRFFEEFVKIVCSEDVKIDDIFRHKVYNSIIDLILNDIKELDLWILIKTNTCLVNEEFNDILYNRVIDKNIKFIYSEISKSKQSNGENLLNIASKLKENTLEPIKIIREYLPTINEDRRIISDSLSNQLLQLAIDYYNGSSNRHDIAYKVLDLMKYAETLAESTIKKERCEHNIKIVSQFIIMSPPKEINKSHIKEKNQNFLKTNKEIKESKVLSVLIVIMVIILIPLIVYTFAGIDGLVGIGAIAVLFVVGMIIGFLKS